MQTVNSVQHLENVQDLVAKTQPLNHPKVLTDPQESFA